MYNYNGAAVIGYIGRSSEEKKYICVGTAYKTLIKF
jgi:hypothetical protein